MTHHLGADLGGGANTDELRKTVMNYRKQGNLQDAGLTIAIGCGGLWPASRCVKEGYLVQTTLCQLCFGAEGTEVHRCWECPVILDLPDEAIISSNHLCQRASEHFQTSPARWLRGITPNQCLQIRAPLAERVFGGFGAYSTADAEFKFCSEGLVVYVDESGGNFAKDPLLRRCGWGIAVLRAPQNKIQEDIHFVGGFCVQPPW